MSSLPFAETPVRTVIFWCAFLLWFVPELVASKLTRAGANAEVQDRGSLSLVAVLWCLGIAIDFLIAVYYPRMNLSVARSQAFFFGTGAMICGVAFRWYSAWILGKYFTFDVAIRDDQRLIETGPYRYLRHPSYTGALITLLGFGLALGNWASVFAGTICLGLAYAYRIRIEEAALTAGLGERYSSYVKRTWRLIPFVF